ncbi:hypothetical protein OROHE_020501 [Orobanche hederae]
MSNQKYDGESKLISVNSTTLFDDFIAQASGKWNGITDLNMVLRYSVVDVRNCSLDCEDDLRNLFSICQILSAKLVFVDISKSVEKQIAMIEHQNDTGDQNEHVHPPNEHVLCDYEHVHSGSVDSNFYVNRRSRTNKTTILKTTSWFIKAKLQTITNFFVVTKVYLDHSCIGKLVGNKNTHFGAKISGNIVVDNIRADPNCNGKDIQKTLWVSSIVSLDSNPNNNCFERVFIAFKACLDGFKKCRPMLFIDGTFMIGRAKGTLLGATTKDGDNGKN